MGDGRVAGYMGDFPAVRQLVAEAVSPVLRLRGGGVEAEAASPILRRQPVNQ